MSKIRFLGILALILSTFASRTDVVFAKSLMNNFPTIFVLFIGSFVAFITLFFYLEIKSQIKELWIFSKKNFFLLWVNSLLAGVIGPFFFLIALKNSSIVSASFFIAFTPLFTTILAYFFLNERDLRVNFFIGGVFMIFGMLFIITNGFNSKFDFNFYNLFALGASFFYSISNIIAKKHIPYKHLDYFLTSKTFCTTLVLGIFSCILLGFNKVDISSLYSMRFNILGYGIVAVMLGYLLFYYGLRNISAHESAMILLLSPLIGSFYGFIFLNEKISLSQIYGGIFMIIGMIFINIHLIKKVDLVRHKLHQKHFHG